MTHLSSVKQFASNLENTRSYAPPPQSSFFIRLTGSQMPWCRQVYTTDRESLCVRVLYSKHTRSRAVIKIWLYYRNYIILTFCFIYTVRIPLGDGSADGEASVKQIFMQIMRSRLCMQSARISRLLAEKLSILKESSVYFTQLSQMAAGGSGTTWPKRPLVPEPRLSGLQPCICPIRKVSSDNKSWQSCDLGPGLSHLSHFRIRLLASTKEWVSRVWPTCDMHVTA